MGGGGGADLIPFLAQISSILWSFGSRTLYAPRFGTCAPLYKKKSRYLPDGIYVENYDNCMVCN